MKINIIHFVRQVARLASLVVLAAVSTTLTNAAGSHLDYRFSTDGWVATGFGNLFNPANDLANAAVVQPDGKIIVVGGTTVGGNYDFAVVRYRTDGSLDTTFGTGGKVSTGFTSGIDIAEGAVVMPDGRIIVIGYYEYSSGNYQPALATYLSNGTNESITYWNYGPGSTIPTSVALAPNGKVVMAGYVTNGATNFNWWVMRLAGTSSTLTNDPSFGGGDGIVTTDFNGGNDTAAAVTVQADNSVVVAGTVQGSGRNGQDFGIVRYTPTGSLDTTFGTGGKATTNFGAGSNDRALALLRNGSAFVVAGDSTIFGGSIALAEYDYYGKPLATFGGDGRVTTNLNPDSTETASSIVWDGAHYVVAGHVDSTVLPTTFTLVRYNIDGRLDDTFGTHGRINTIIGTGNATAESLVAKTYQGVGQIIAVGSLHTATDYEMVTAAYTDPGAATRSDISSDGLADFGVFRPSEGVWYFSDGGNGAVSTITLGANGDIPVPGDYDRDGITDAALYRPSNRNFYIRKSSNQTIVTSSISGSPDDVPVQGDYDGDGKTDVAIYSPSDSTWSIARSTLGLTTAGVGVPGLPGDKPVQGDYDGDGKTDLAIFRPSNGTWYIRRSTFGSTSIQFGLSGDIPVPADYDGDGRADIAVFRPSNASWYVITSQNGATVTTQWGLAGDIPSPADFDKDGKADLTVYRAGSWFVLRSSDGATGGLSFGLAGDIPVSSAYTLQ